MRLRSFILSSARSRGLPVMVCSIFGALSTHAAEIFLNADWENPVPSPSVAVWSGGNVSPTISGILTNSVYVLNTNQLGLYSNTPVAVNGFNRDVIVENTANGTDTSPYAQPFDYPGIYTPLAFYEQGITSISYTGGNGTNEGLPPSGQFTSILDGVTRFQFGPYNGNNVLFLTVTNPSGTLTLANPSSFNSLAILAASSEGGGYGSFVITFSDNTTSPPILFNASDYYLNNNSGAAITHFGRIYCGYYGSLYTDDPAGNDPNFYQTTINLGALGLNTKAITGLTFTMPNGPGTSTNTMTGVFAVSGTMSQYVLTPVAVPFTNSICLAESAIGQIAAQSVGYPGAANDLAAAASKNILAGTAYQYTQVAGVPTPSPAIAWNIVFPGGFNPATGSNYDANATANYIANDIAQADYDLRARLQVNPADASAAQQLVLLVDDQMLPLEWCGTEALVYSTYARLNGFTQNGTNVETLDVEQARGYFQSACNVFQQFLANPVNADLVEGQNPLVSAAITNQVSQILDDYLRDLYAYAEASLTDFQLRQLANFYDPSVAGSAPSQSLLNDIDSTVSEIQMRLLLASPFANLPIYTTSAAKRISSILHDLRRFHQSVVLGRVTFNTGASGDPTGDPSLDYGEFTTSFVPFFNGLDNPGNSTFDVALNLAQTFTTYAASQESDATTDIKAILQSQYDWASQQNSLQNQYLSQLQNLCGYTLDANGDPSFPDIFFCSLPPGVRESVAAQCLPAGTYQLDNTGTIYQQWQSVQTAETNLLLATTQLNNTFATILYDAQVGNAIYSNETSFAQTILTNGRTISTIDQQEGQVQAQTDLANAQVQANDAQQQNSSGWWSTIEKVGAIVGAAVATAYSGGAASPLLAAALSSAPGVATAVAGQIQASADLCAQAAADISIGNNQANEATQIADMNAQIQQINSSEQSQSEYLQASTEALNLSAQLNSLTLQAKAQEVQVQLAAQSVDQENSKLANMLAQTSSLINQWVRSAALTEQNPEFSSNLLLTRDATIQQYNDAFALAQEWAFLAALALDYKDNCPNAYSFVPLVLKARRTADLIPIMNQMNSAETLITTGCENSPFYTTVQFSIRNNFVQANQTTGTGTNTTVSSYQPVLQGGLPVANAGASQTNWANYLASNLITNEFGERVLVLDFSTSLTDQTIGGVQRNPFFTCETFGTTLYSGSDNNGNELHGVQVSLTVPGSLSLPLGSSDGFPILLAQTGTSAIRNRGFGNVASTPGYRYFNFGYFATGIDASANNLNGNGGTSAFQDRSPANGQWQLSINEDDSANNETLINNLSQLTDIQLQFSIRSYIDQIAAQKCTSSQ